MSAIAAGVELFNAQKFWHAHEAWEELWLHASGDEKIFLQGLIQLAAAYHHAQRGTFRGGVRLFDAALSKLERFENGRDGIDRSDAVAAAAEQRTKFSRGEHIAPGELPKLRYN